MCFSIKSHKCQCLAFRSIHKFNVNNFDGDRIMSMNVDLTNILLHGSVYVFHLCMQFDRFGQLNGFRFGYTRWQGTQRI